ncbi:MAG TPA: substrate-binding domain-containing protein [Acidimicrobiales bacterium]
MHTAAQSATRKDTLQTKRIATRLAVATSLLGIAFVGLSLPAGADTSGATTTTTIAASSSGTGSTTTTTTTAGSAPSGTNSSTTTTTFPPQGKYSVSHSGTGLNGTGSSFAAPAIETFDSTVKPPPYNLTINYSSTSSGDGRYEFTNGTTDFAVSDIAYGLGSADATPPVFHYIYVPITAGGIAFMYNIPGLTKNLQLDSYTTCAILTGGITNWNNSKIAAQNPGVSLPNMVIRPVTESDPAGTNYVLEEWCIDEQPSLWAAFANYENAQAGNQVVISQSSPNSQWPAVPGGLDTDSTAAVTSDIQTNSGAIGAVQLQYATDAGFGQSDPSKGVAAELNASGDYALPTPPDVASALAYATQLPNGTHQLNFNGVGPHVYNPSTYSYLLTPAAGWQPAKGAVMSAYVNYALTLGQKLLPSNGFASLGLSLERYGIDSVIQDVPGAVAVTAAENAGYSCGDLTPSEVAAGQTTPTCGVTVASAPIPPKNGVGSSLDGSATSGGAGGSSSAGGGSGGSGSSGGSSGGAGGVDPAVSLSGSVPLAFTGGDPRPVVLIGMLLLLTGWAGRRRLIGARRRREAP